MDVKTILQNASALPTGFNRINAFIKNNHKELANHFECWYYLDNILSKLENKQYENDLEKRDLDIQFIIDKYIIKDLISCNEKTKKEWMELKQKLYVFGNDQSFKFLEDPIDKIVKKNSFFNL